MDVHVHLPRNIGRLRKTSCQNIGAEELEDLTKMEGPHMELISKTHSRTYISKIPAFQQSILY